MPLGASPVLAQNVGSLPLLATPATATFPAPAWQDCTSLSGDREARLACFDKWAAQQSSASISNEPALGVAASEAPAVASATPVVITMEAPAAHNCRNSVFSEISRFWELEPGSDCGTFGLRGYRPISLSWIGSDSTNTQPSSEAPDHTAATPQPYNPNETRIQLSVRTKIAQGLLTHSKMLSRDSLWFGYSQQSYWQLFNGDLSRPFRSTDHEPEITYIYPTDAALPGDWRLRYTGVSLVHQSNGQSLPLSRSWNRVVLMAGMEKGQQFRVLGKVWKRLEEDPADDDNPNISDYIGRAEVTGLWDINPINTLSMTLRHSLRADTNGSLRLDWFRDIADSSIPGGRRGLRFHTQLFTGYGDSLLDYNRRRTVLSIGLSLADW